MCETSHACRCAGRVPGYWDRGWVETGAGLLLCTEHKIKKIKSIDDPAVPGQTLASDLELVRGFSSCL
jgi:hypothetical protein